MLFAKPDARSVVKRGLAWKGLLVFGQEKGVSLNAKNKREEKNKKKEEREGEGEEDLRTGNETRKCPAVGRSSSQAARKKEFRKS